MQSCGGCSYFIKWKFDRFGGGLCEFHDSRTKTDNGHKCSDHLPFKYERLAVKADVRREIDMEMNAGE